MMEQSPNSPPQGLQLQHYLEILLRWKWIALAGIALMVTGSALWTFSRTRVYRAGASVLINKAPPEVLGNRVREVVDPSREYYADNEEYLQNQMAVACSTEVAGLAARRLNLHQNARFWGTSQISGRTVEDAGGMLLALTGCSIRRKTSIMDLTVEHTDPVLAATIANAMARAYIDKNLEYRLSSTFGAVQWLSKQLDDLRGQLTDSEKSLHEFKRTNNLLSVPLSGQQNLLTRNIDLFNTELAQVRIKRMALVAQLDQLKALDVDDPLDTLGGPLLSSAVMTHLKAAYIEERRKYLGLKERYLEKHPLVLEQQVRMASAARDFKREVDNHLAGLRATLKQVTQQEKQLAGAIEGAKTAALALSLKEEQFRQLQRPVETTSKLYEMLLSRMKEGSLLGNLRINNMHVLERAEPSFAPIRPRVTINLIIGALLGILLGLGLVFLLESLDNSVKSEEDVLVATGLNCLGAIPRVSVAISGGRGDPHPMLARSPSLIVHHRPLSVAAESWKAVRTNLLFTSPDRPIRTIVVTSPGPKEGKTTVTAGLAAALAQSGKPVLLIDGDLRQPQLHRVLDVPRDPGLTSALRGDEEVEPLIKSTEVPNLFVLTCGPIPPNPAELCQSERLYGLVRALKERFAYILIDAPPVMLVTDPVLLAARFDATLLVGRTGRTAKKAIQECHRQLAEVGARVIGCVLNDMDITPRQYRYYAYRKRPYMAMGYGEQHEEKAGS